MGSPVSGNLAGNLQLRISTATGGGHDLPRSQPIGRFAQRLRSRFDGPMPALTRKRVNDRPVTWHIHYAGVRVGVIVERSGVPPSFGSMAMVLRFLSRR
jgi:hypothetical protein